MNSGVQPPKNADGWLVWGDRILWRCYRMADGFYGLGVMKNPDCLAFTIGPWAIVIGEKL